MSLTRLSSEQMESILADLRTLGVEGSNLLAVPPFALDADSHSYIREILLAFLRAMFRSMPEESFRWDPEASKTKIQIRYADPRKDQEPGATPTISVELSPFTYGNHAINNFLGRVNGEDIFTDLRNGAAVIRCRSNVKLESDSLASAVMGAFKYMHRELEKLSGFTWIDGVNANPSSGELNQTSTEGEFFVATVVVNVHYQETWKKSSNTIVSGPVIFNPDPQGEFFD